MNNETLDYLKSLESVRDRTSPLLRHPEYLNFFDVNLSACDDVVSEILDLIKRDYPGGPQAIPPHSRWRHFDVNGVPRVKRLLATWTSQRVPLVDQVRSLLDLFVVSVLLDAGAGAAWSYLPNGEQTKLGRSEGLALASLDFFLNGGFSSSETAKCQVDAKGLQGITAQRLGEAFQVDKGSNPLVGLEGRVALLNRLGEVVSEENTFFTDPNVQTAANRPGNMIFFLLGSDPKGGQIDVCNLWKVVIDGLAGVWPASRTKLYGKSLGDVWPCPALERLQSDAREGKLTNLSQEALLTSHDRQADGLVPFHKLSQWLTYSIMEPLALLPKTEFKNGHLMTGLAEYRNGGLFIDYKVITLKPLATQNAGFKLSGAPYDLLQVEPTHELVVEWRALTVALLDLVGAKVRERLRMTAEELPLAKVLEAGTWKLGREVAAKLRPLTKGPPIELLSDGTLF